MGKDILENSIVKQATSDLTQLAVIIGIVIFAFFLYILVKKNLSSMAYLKLLGVFIKHNRNYRVGGIFEYDGQEYYLDNLNTYDIKFKFVIERSADRITLSTKQKIIPYNLFLKNRIWCGHFGI